MIKLIMLWSGVCSVIAFSCTIIIINLYRSLESLLVNIFLLIGLILFIICDISGLIYFIMTIGELLWK